MKHEQRLHIIIHSKYFSVSDWLTHNSSYWTDDVKSGPKCHIEPLTEKTWGRGWVVLVVKTKWVNSRRNISPTSFPGSLSTLGARLIFHSLHGEILSKVSKKTTAQMTSAIYICRPEQHFYLLNFLVTMHYRYQELYYIDWGKQVLAEASVDIHWSS